MMLEKKVIQNLECTDPCQLSRNLQLRIVGFPRQMPYTCCESVYATRGDTWEPTPPTVSTNPACRLTLLPCPDSPLSFL